MKRNYFLMLMALTLFLFSCRTEQDSLSDKNFHQTDNHDVISFKSFQKETHILQTGNILSDNSVQNKKNQQNNPLSRFIVDTTHINRIIANSTLSTYAFRIYSLYGSPQDLYNMVYRKRSNGTVHYSILKITNTEISLVYDSEKTVLFHTKTHSGSTAKTPCTDYYTEFFHCKNGHSWDYCDKCADCVTTVHIVYGDCGGGSSGTGGNGITYPHNPPVDPPFEGGGGSYNLQDPSGYVFDPNETPTIDPQYVRASRAYLFWTQLGYTNQLFATEHPDIYQNLIENYLNSYSTVNNSNNSSFTQWGLQFFVENPDTTWEQFQNWFLNQNRLYLDYSNNGSNSIIFNNLQDFKLNLLTKNANLITESSVLQNNGSEKIVSARVKRTGVWGSGEEVRIKLKKNNNIWIFDNVTSTEYGLTLGVWSFTQVDYSQNTSSNVLTVEVMGLENYNVFLEGLGTVYKDRVMIRVKININTGNIFNVEFIDL